MTEHSTEELKRQWNNAESAATQARGKAHEAKKRYDEALCRDKIAEFEAMGGVVGVTRVRREKWRQDGKPEMLKGPFVVVGAEVRYGAVEFVLAKIKKDGTPSNAPSGNDCQRVFILPEDQPATSSDTEARSHDD